MAALGLNTTPKNDGLALGDPISTEGGRGGPPLQYVPQDAFVLRVVARGEKLKFTDARDVSSRSHAVVQRIRIVLHV